MKDAAGKHRVALAMIVLAAITVAAYWPVVHGRFVNVDDPGYVAANPHVVHGLTWEGTRWAFGTGYLGNWHPLTWLSHMLLVQCFGLNPAAHHLGNLALHVATTLLLFAFLLRGTGAFARSAAVAGLFALHPLHVQSVAWVSERKDVLSGVFFFLTLLAYVKYAESRSIQFQGRAESDVAPAPKSGPAAGPGNPGTRKLYYFLALLFFTLGLMSKPMLVTLPFVLLLLDYWPLNRGTIVDTGGEERGESPPESHGESRMWRLLRLRGLLLEKAPFLALSAAICVITFSIQDRSGAMSPARLFPLGLRVMNSTASYARYLGKTLWPSNMAFFYPYPRSVPAEVFVAAFMLLAGVSYLAFKCRRQCPYLLVGWLWYLGTLVPVIGLVKVGSEAMADRYMYLPSVGLFVAVVWGVAELLRNRESWRVTVCGASLLLVPVLAFRTYSETQVWHDTETLARRALEVTTDNAAANVCMGGVSMAKGNLEEAAAYFQEATRIVPDFAKTWLYLGEARVRQGRPAAAVESLKTADQLDPGDPATCFTLGEACQMLGDDAAAERYYRRSNLLEKDQIMTLNNLAWILATASDPALRNGAEAEQLALRACELSHYEKALYMGTLAAAYAEAGKFDLAAAMVERARARALAIGNKEVAAKAEQLLAIYKSGRAYHEPLKNNK